MRRLTVVAAALTLAACTDATLPDAPGSTPAQAPGALRGIDAETRALLDAARDHAPIDVGDHLLVGVLQQGRTADSRVVLFDNGAVQETWRYRRTGAGWTRREMIGAPVQVAAARAGGPRMYVSSGPYPYRIAVIGNNADTWYSDKTSTGDYSYSKLYRSNTYGWAQFYNGTARVGSSQLTVSSAGWSAWNWYYPGCSWSSFSAYLSSSGCQVYPWGYPGPYTYVDADYFTAYYHLDVVPVLTVSISGPGGISTPGTYTWSASVSNGNGTYAYQWSRYWENSGVTETLGTGSSQSLYVDPAYGNFVMNVTVTSGSETASASRYVTVSTCGGPVLC